MSVSAHLDLAGVGVGPSNLSIAALAESLPGIRCRFFDRQTDLRWHPGLMLPGSHLQVSHLKDLVSLVDPTSPHTFLNFLAVTGRLHRFAGMSRQVITRREYESYLRWVARGLGTVEFGCAVEEVDFRDGAFRIDTSGGRFTAQHLSVAVGLTPTVPDPAVARLGPTVFHSADFARHGTDLAGRDVVVVGGGQSGAEIVDYLLGLTHHSAVRSLVWTSRRHGFQPLDDTAFTNEWFHPDYVRHFHGLPEARRKELLGGQRLASDGVSAGLLERIYRRLYENDFVDQDPIPCAVLPGRELVALTPLPDRRWRIELLHGDSGERETREADIVVLATGYRFRLPDFLHPIADRIPMPANGHLPLEADYSLPWAGPAGNRLFFLNAGRLSHGIADPNLSLASWRAATVLGSITPTPWSIDRRSSVSVWDRAVPAPVVGARAKEGAGR